MAGGRSYGRVPTGAIAQPTAQPTNGERRWPGAAGPLEWGVGNRAKQRNRRGGGTAVRAARAVEARCRRDAGGGLQGADAYVVLKGGISACHNALDQLPCAMWPVGRRTSPTGVDPQAATSKVHHDGGGTVGATPPTVQLPRHRAASDCAKIRSEMPIERRLHDSRQLSITFDPPELMKNVCVRTYSM